MWKIKALRKIYGPVYENGSWRITSSERPGYSASCKGHVRGQWQTAERSKVFKGDPEGYRPSTQTKKELAR